jgi:NAD(P)-dependent dehydrogenase (short-subunit alcohol dehydrogenase family)
MATLPKSFRALVIGSSGTIGSTFVESIKNHPDCTEVIGLHRHSEPAIDYDNPESIESAALALANHAPFQLIIIATGVLHSDQWHPEKKLADLNTQQLSDLMLINAIGPALTLKSFVPLLDSSCGILVTLSAKVGSIEDNRLGGWYSYRASKAALNMLIKTSAIELKRTKPNLVVIAMHPGTVNSRLSKPFKGEQIGRPAIDAVQDMLRVITSLSSEDSGKFLSYSGEELPW